jgi:hypothetical protein
MMSALKTKPTQESGPVFLIIRLYEEEKHEHTSRTTNSIGSAPSSAGL